MDRIIATFVELKAEEYLSEGWVKNVWLDNGFTRYIPFPSDYDVFLEEVNISNLINDHYNALCNWFRAFGTTIEQEVSNYSHEKGDNNSELNWQTLIQEGVDFKALISILGTLILRFQEEPHNPSYFHEAVTAIRLYTLLVAIPGSHICQIFNPTLYSHVVAVIQVCCEQIDGAIDIANKSTKRKKNDNMEINDENTNRLDCNKSELILLTNDFLGNLKMIIENKKFKLDKASLHLTIQILIMITKLEKINAALLVYQISTFSRNSVSHIAYKSFLILLLMAKIMHNDLTQSIKLILAELLPIFLLNEPRTVNVGAKDSTIIRANYTCFLKMLIDEYDESVYDSINILIQRICVSVPDRAEIRNKATSTVMDIIKISPPELQAKAIYSVIFLSNMPETKTRIQTLEIISQLLLDDSIHCHRLSESYAAIVNETFLLAIIFYRCQDISAGIRTKALTYLDQFISHSNPNAKVKQLMDTIFVTPYINVENPEQVDQYEKRFFDTNEFLINQGDYDDTTLDPLPGAKIVLLMLIHYSHEDKVFIKKCAIQLLSKILQRNRLWIKRKHLEVFLIGCDDSSVLVRKTMSQIITDLLMMYPDHPEIITCWVEGVCPMIAEEEAKAQEKVVEYYTKVILNNIMLYDHTTSIISRLPWLIMREILKQNKRVFLHFGVSKWIQNNLAKPKTIQTIYSHLGTENNDIAWCLLLSFSQLMNLPNNDIIYEQYNHVKKNWEAIPHSQLVLETLFHVCSKMSKELKENLLRQLEKDLIDCKIPLKLIARSRDICELLVIDGADKRKAHAAVKDWATPMIKNCLNFIESQISKNSPLEVTNETRLMNYIFLLGELAQPVPKQVPKSMVKLLLNVLLSPKKREDDMWKGRVTTSLKAACILTLIKVSLQREETASSIMPIFREILSSDSVPSCIQVNVIIGMCDLCSRYTTLVERYFSCICKCFNSQHECVRKTALVSLIKRIREEYVKLRPFIFFPMLTMILDKSVEIKCIIATFIEIDLKKKNILESFYTGLFFFLNNCKNHSTTVKISDEIRAMFSSTAKPKIREYIYIYVLDKLADTSKRLLVCRKIFNDIIISVADEVLKLDEKTENILSDALLVLTDNERKIANAISKKRGNNEEDEEIEDPEPSQGKKIHGHVVANITEAIRITDLTEIMPIIFKLRQILKKNKSKCSKDLVLYVCELLKHYKEEISDLLIGDPELKAEAMYQSKQMEIEQEQLDQTREESEPDAPDINPKTVKVITEHLKNLIVEITRCDNLLPRTQNINQEAEVREFTNQVELEESIEMENNGDEQDKEILPNESISENTDLDETD